jgi:hypothetical protein
MSTDLFADEPARARKKLTVFRAELAHAWRRHGAGLGHPRFPPVVGAQR